MRRGSIVRRGVIGGGIIGSGIIGSGIIGGRVMRGRRHGSFIYLFCVPAKRFLRRKPPRCQKHHLFPLASLLTMVENPGNKSFGTLNNENK